MYFYLGFNEAPGRPKPKSGQLTFVLGNRFFEGPQIQKKGLQKAPGRPKLKSDQFYQQLTYWQAAFLKGPKSPDAPDLHNFLCM